MSEFFGFMFQVTVVFVVLWYFGLNFFKHSHYISAWWDKRKLQKLADENKDKIVNMREVFKKEFGFLETPEYVKKRMTEIKTEMSNPKSDHVLINALEFIFLIDDLKTQVLKTDKGVYIVSRKNINELIMKQERDVLYYARKMREYALQFLPKEGEPIVLEADEVLYWIRNGMLRRPSGENGNRTFKLKSSIEEVYLNLKEDFVEPHYSLSIVSHNDFLKIKKRRNQVEEKTRKKAVLEPENKLVEGMNVLFSDNTKRMKIGNTVIVTGGNGRTWKEDLDGNIIEEDVPRGSVGIYDKEGNIKKEAFIKKEASQTQEEMSLDVPEAKIPNTLAFMGDKTKQENEENKSAASRVSSRDSESKTAVPEKESLSVEKFVCGSYQELTKKIVSSKAARASFVESMIRGKFPALFMVGESVYVSEKHFVDVFSRFLDPVSRQVFMLDLVLSSGKVNAKILFEIYVAMEKADILLFEKGGKKSTLLSFANDGKTYTVKSLAVSDAVLTAETEDIRKVQPKELTREEQKQSDYWISIDRRENAVQDGGKKKESDDENDAILVSLKFEKKEKAIPAEKDRGQMVEKKENIRLEPKTEVHQNSEEPTVTKVGLSKKKGAFGNQTKDKGPKEKPKKKQKMSYEVFVQKFCTAQWILADEVFEKRSRDCEQGYVAFSLCQDDIRAAEVYVGFDLFRKKLLSFLEKEDVEHRDSRSFFNTFLRDGNKGDVSVRYFYTSPDNTAIKMKVASLRIPLEKLEGLRLDLGIRGGLRLSELDRAIAEAEEIGDTETQKDLVLLRANINQRKIIDCEERGNEN